MFLGNSVLLQGRIWEVCLQAEKKVMHHLFLITEMVALALLLLLFFSLSPRNV